MKITERMAEIIERNAGEMKLTKYKDGSVGVTFVFEPQLDMKSEDGIIFKEELKKQLRIK